MTCRGPLSRRVSEHMERAKSIGWIQALAASLSSAFGFNQPDTIELGGYYYAIVKTFDLLDNKYYMLINLEDCSDMFFRKRLLEDGEEYMIALDNSNEVDRLIRCYVDEIVNLWSAWWPEAPDLSLVL